MVRDDVTAMSLTGPVKTVTDGEGTIWSARSVILAMGSAYRQMGIPDEQRLAGHGVSWCATCDGFFFRDQDIVVVGGGDSAVEEATFLTKFAASVTIVHRRDELRASKIMAARAMADPKISFAWNSAVEAIHGQDKVTAVTLRDTVSGATRLLPVTGVFVAIGHDPRNELIKGVIDLDENGYVTVQPASTATNIAGVFAAGDLVDHTYRQAITAAGTGCAAALRRHQLDGLGRAGLQRPALHGHHHAAMELGHPSRARLARRSLPEHRAGPRLLAGRATARRVPGRIRMGRRRPYPGGGRNPHHPRPRA